MTAVEKTRRFKVYARHLDAHHARLLEGPSFESAAVAYVEDLHELSDGNDQISVVVHDLDSGHEHCFFINLETGEAAPRTHL